MLAIRILSLAALFRSAWSHSRRSLCLTAPSVNLEAGESQLSAMIDVPLEGRCEATMQFYDTSSLPIHFSFEDLTCDGKQINSFTVPKGVANGEVDVIWQCAGLPQTCTHAVVSGGLADSSIRRLYAGRAGCLVESLRTKTTLVTLTRSLKTVVETVPTVFTMTTTSYRASSTTESVPSNIFMATDTISTRTTGHPPATTTTKADATSTTDDAPDIHGENLTLEFSGSASTSTLSGVESTSSGNSVFGSDASRTTTGAMLPAVTVSLVSTLTVMRTISAECSSN